MSNFLRVCTTKMRTKPCEILCCRWLELCSLPLPPLLGQPASDTRSCGASNKSQQLSVLHPALHALWKHLQGRQTCARVEYCHRRQTAGGPQNTLSAHCFQLWSQTHIQPFCFRTFKPPFNFAVAVELSLRAIPSLQWHVYSQNQSQHRIYDSITPQESSNESKRVVLTVSTA